MSNGQKKRWLLDAIHECQRGCGRAALSLRNLEDVPSEYVEHLPEDGEHVRMARGLLSVLARFVEASDEEAVLVGRVVEAIMTSRSGQIDYKLARKAAKPAKAKGKAKGKAKTSAEGEP